MRPLHIKKKRSTREDAHIARKAGRGGGISLGDFLSEHERRAMAEDAAERLENVVRDHFPRTQNLEYAVLKTHLIVEFALTELIRCSSYIAVDSSDIKFTFMQKLNVAILNGFGVGSITMIPSVEIINQIRNQVAHQFSIDRSLVLELVQVNSDEGDPKPSTLNDRQLISRLRSFSAFFCGLSAGHITAAVSGTAK